MNIKDEILDPFYIQVNNDTYDLIEVKASKKDGRIYNYTVGYYSTLKGAIKKAARLKVERSANGGNIDLRTYLNRLENIESNLNELINK